MQIIKPPLIHKAMCVYRITLNTGYFYIGATTDFGDRIDCHLKAFRKNQMPIKLQKAFSEASVATFEFIRFVNDRKNLSGEEEKYLKMYVGLPLCLNTKISNLSDPFSKQEKCKIAKVTDEGKVIQIFDDAPSAAIELGINVNQVLLSVQVKYPRTKYILRRITKSGKLKVPVKSYREYPMLRKAVIQSDKAGNVINKYESIADACRKTLIDKKTISAAVNGRKKTGGGFLWSADTAICSGL